MEGVPANNSSWITEWFFRHNFFITRLFSSMAFLAQMHSLVDIFYGRLVRMLG